MSKAEKVVDALLENEAFQKWDKAHGTLRHLWAQEKKAHELKKELVRSVEYHRALAKHGIKKEEVSHVLHGGQIGAIDNYKRKRPAKQCKDEMCSTRKSWAGMQKKLKTFPLEAEQCSACGGELEPTEVPISPAEMRDRYQNYIVGVELKDGRRVFFDEMLHPTPWMAWENDPVAPEPPDPEKV